MKDLIEERDYKQKLASSIIKRQFVKYNPDKVRVKEGHIEERIPGEDECIQEEDNNMGV
ncbi:hypothetical protein SAMN05216249_102209 [Acetitomaculum ruminis DSM 5522]|uniref:Uncharacterized protein n=1 Tax=Acetitomaculum ruminis DSM 5522 TaxID=1120918 RepID=A0A1I0VVJ8_9FIRM|nr:hypothetical protein [Acetitomaculum ruminis]SFA80067.1 hypothetical protein SAMN05216249_102209 [Acetitomaculum ruminis DSM 5522]